MPRKSPYVIMLSPEERLALEEKARQYLQKAGFHSIKTNRLPHDIQNNWYVIRK